MKVTIIKERNPIINLRNKLRNPNRSKYLMLGWDGSNSIRKTIPEHENLIFSFFQNFEDLRKEQLKEMF